MWKPRGDAESSAQQFACCFAQKLANQAVELPQPPSSYNVGRVLGSIFASRGSCVGKNFGSAFFVCKSGETCAGSYKP